MNKIKAYKKEIEKEIKDLKMNEIRSMKTKVMNSSELKPEIRKKEGFKDNQLIIKKIIKDTSKEREILEAKLQTINKVLELVSEEINYQLNDLREQLLVDFRTKLHPDSIKMFVNMRIDNVIEKLNLEDGE